MLGQGGIGLSGAGKGRNAKWLAAPTDGERAARYTVRKMTAWRKAAQCLPWHTQHTAGPAQRGLW